MIEPGQTDLSKYYKDDPNQDGMSPTVGSMSNEEAREYIRSKYLFRDDAKRKPEDDLYSLESNEDDAIDVDSETEDGLSAGQAAASLGIDIGGSIGSQVIGATTGIGYIPIAFGGGMLSNIIAQTTAEGRSFDDIQWGRAFSAGVINLIPGSSTMKLARPIATEVGRGALIGAADVTAQKMIDEKRMPTAGEYLVATGAGGVLGGAAGAAVKHFNEAKGMVYGMNYSDIDKVLLTKKGEPLRRTIADLGYDWTDDRIIRETDKLKTKIAAQKDLNDKMEVKQGWMGVNGVFRNLNPFLVTGDSIRTQSYQFDQRVRTLENFQRKLPKEIQDGLEGFRGENNKLMLKFGREIDDYLDGKEMTQNLGDQKWSGALKEFRDMEDDFYDDLITVLGSEDKYDNMFADFSDTERKYFRNRVERARRNNSHRARQYKALIPGAKEQGTDRVFELDGIEKLKAKSSDEKGVSLYQAIVTEIKDWQVKNNPNVKTQDEIDEITEALKDSEGKLSAEANEKIKQYKTEEQLVGTGEDDGLIHKHLENLISRNNPKGKKAILKNTLPGNVEMILGNHVPGELESKWLGEVTDVGFRMKQGMFGGAIQMAKFKSNKLTAQALVDEGIVSPVRTPGQQEEIKVFSELKGDFYTNKETAYALDQIFGNRFIQQQENKLLDTALGAWKRSESMSKAVKVLFNPPSYFVNFWGANFSMIGMGMIPEPITKGGRENFKNISSFFKGGEKGLRQSPLMERILEDAKEGLGGNITSQNRQEILSEVRELQSLGVLDPDTGSLLADDITQGMKTGKSQIMQSIQKGTEFVGKIYSLSDVAARLAVFDHNKRKLGKIFPELATNSDEVFKRMAAELTNDTYQNYGRVSKTIRNLSKVGVMPQFVTFTAELMRNVFHQYKSAARMMQGKFGTEYGLSAEDLSKANLEAMRAEGAKRMTWLTSMIGLSTVGVDSFNKLNGVDEEKDNYFRSQLPQYLTNKSLLYKIDKNDPNNIAVVNASYIMPQAIIGSLIQALQASASQALGGEPQERDIIQFFLDEFAGEGTFFTAEIYRSIDNRDKYGEKISRAIEANEYMYDMFHYIAKEAFETGFQRELQKLEAAYNSDKSLYSKSEVWLRQFGARFQKIDLSRQITFNLQDLADAQSAYKGDYTKAKRYEFPEGRINEEQLEERYQLNNNRNRKVYEKMLKTYQDTLKHSGLSKEAVDDIFMDKRSNLSSHNKISIMSNLPYKNLPREIIMTQREQYDTMFGDGTNINDYSDVQIRKQINSIRKTDKLAYKTFKRMYEADKRIDGAKNMSNVEKLIKKLSVHDRAIIIKDLGLDNYSSLRKLRRLGIYTDDVKEVMRIIEEQQRR